MIITRDQADTYIKPGNVLRRTIYTERYNHRYTQEVEVVSEIFPSPSNWNKELTSFKYKSSSTPNAQVRNYYTSDFFNGKVELIKQKDYLESELFEI